VQNISLTEGLVGITRASRAPGGKARRRLTEDAIVAVPGIEDGGEKIVSGAGGILTSASLFDDSKPRVMANSAASGAALRAPYAGQTDADEPLQAKLMLARYQKNIG